MYWLFLLYCERTCNQELRLRAACCCTPQHPHLLRAELELGRKRVYNIEDEATCKEIRQGFLQENHLGGLQRQ